LRGKKATNWDLDFRPNLGAPEIPKNGHMGNLWGGREAIIKRKTEAKSSMAIKTHKNVER